MMKKYFNLRAISAYLLSLICFAPLAFGQDGNTTSGTTIENPLKVNTLADFASVLLDGVVQIMTPIIVAYVIYVGYLFLEARGNPSKIKTAKDALSNVLIGAAIVIGAKVIAVIIKSTISTLQ